MKTKTPVSTKKQTVTLKDLKATKNPKGGTVQPIASVPIGLEGDPGALALKPGLKQGRK